MALAPEIPEAPSCRRAREPGYHRSERFEASLRRCLHAYARRHAEVGYVQGMHNVLAFMLIAGLGEEESVLLLHHVATRVLPMYWHTDAGAGTGGGNASGSSNTILTDVLVAGFIARRELPALTHHLESIGVDLSHVTLPLFLTCFTANGMSYEFVASCWYAWPGVETQRAPRTAAGLCMPPPWKNNSAAARSPDVPRFRPRRDFLLFESDDGDDGAPNNSFMFRLILAMLKTLEPELRAAGDAVACIRALTSMPLRFTAAYGAGEAEMSVRELLLTASEFAESCSPKQIRLLRRELATFSPDNEAEAEAAGEGSSPRSFQLYRSLSDSHGALQDQIDMLMETLSIQVRPRPSRIRSKFDPTGGRPLTSSCAW